MPLPANGAEPIPSIDLAPHRPFVEPDPAILPDQNCWLLSNSAAATAIRRSLNALPALLTWLIVLSPLWAGYLLPLPLALAILAFDGYWLYLSVTTARRAYQAHRKMGIDASTDWRKRYRAARIFRRTFVDWDAVRHVVIIPNFRESEAILARTLDSLATQTDPAQIHVVLAMEERDPDRFTTSRALVEGYRHLLGGVYVTIHPAGLPGEVAGKSANEAWAALWVRRALVDDEGWDLNTTTITSCDADTVFHPSYFACLTYKFATDSNRYRRFWQSAILLNNNIWDSPAPLRVASALAGVHLMSNLMRRNRMMFPQSTYSLSMRMADDVGYWDADVIPEDWHMFLKCFYAFKGDVVVEPIFLPTSNDAVHSGSYSGSLKMAYIQHKRHAWGSCDIPYAIMQGFAHPEIPARRKGRRLIALMGNHLIWSTHWFILSLGWIMPQMIARLFGHGHSPFWLPATARVLLWLCLLPYVSMFVLDRRVRPPKPASWRTWQTVADVAWWILLPITSFVFSTLPALEAQTRLAIGKRLEYRVTDKKAVPSVKGRTAEA